MFNVLMSCFLSFAMIGASFGDCSVSTLSLDENGIETEHPVTISKSSKEVDWWYEGIIGRHEMVQILDYEYIGLQNVHTLAGPYNANVLTNFKFTETVSTVNTLSLSTTQQLSSKVTTGIEVRAGVSETVSASRNVTSVYTIENTLTYTTSTSITFTVQYEPKQELIENSKFALCLGAYVYKLECKTWKYDNYWWGNYTVSGSTKYFTSYITVDPFVTLEVNGEVLEVI